MSSNILTGKPNNCADGVLTGSKYLNDSPPIGGGQLPNTISPKYTETTVELSKRATPKDCAACINRLGEVGEQICMLKLNREQLGEKDAIQATHSNLIKHDPRERLKLGHALLTEQSVYFDLRDAWPEEHLVRVAADLAESGFSPDKLAEIGLPEIDREAIQDQAA